MKHAATAVLTFALAACNTGSDGTSMGRISAAPPAVEATTQLLGPNGELRGTATLSQRGTGTRVAARVEGLAPGTYAIHVHEFGKCDAPKFETAGAHFNPTVKQHGSMNPAGPHAGDLPNIVVATSGRGSIDAEQAGLQLTGGATPALDADGAAILVHAKPDDYKTDPSGNSGDRIACGALAAR